MIPDLGSQLLAVQYFLCTGCRHYKENKANKASCAALEGVESRLKLFVFVREWVPELSSAEARGGSNFWHVVLPGQRVGGECPTGRVDLTKGRRWAVH